MEHQTFFAASNLIKATSVEQRGYFEMCIGTAIGERLGGNRAIHEESPVMTYNNQPQKVLPCVEAIENDFKNRYPITSSRHKLLYKLEWQSGIVPEP